ncbi:elongation of very long chain fatty acids protein 4-like [Teleopsis dalmanni]|uniref:elongation of very long chain fatty acids protein 4-like n=1 Tax=Teleopsis dalmanni TaxID=139649 RepID=UPI0018CE5D2E|nr:elongation of very long chain fatty acids protein 4-like [Teleopsis dalmanni]
MVNFTIFLTHFPYEHLADKRTKHWLLVDSFWNMITLVALYLLLVFYMPKWLKNHKPLELKTILIVYNISMAALNAHIFKEIFLSTWHLKYNYFCEPCKLLYSKYEMKIATAVWWFYFSKLLEFADTIFFILRKKYEQLSFLHIYHHSTMFPLWWIAIKWVPTGSTFFPTLINSFVHVVMYTYYGLSAFGPTIRKYLWWKKYLTLLQLTQFTVGLLWAVQAIVYNCDFPTWINYATMFYMISFLILFGRFYTLKYKRKCSIKHK